MAIKPIKLELGTIYQKEDGGTYYFRYQINGERKAVSRLFSVLDHNSELLLSSEGG